MTSQVIMIAILFSTLFIFQTIFFTYLLMRLKKAVKLSRPALSSMIEHDITHVTPITDSMRRILEEIADNGSLSARELSKRLGLSREHTARTLKRLVEEGFLIREGKPYRYKLTDLGEKLLRSRDVKRSE